MRHRNAGLASQSDCAHGGLTVQELLNARVAQIASRYLRPTSVACVQWRQQHTCNRGGESGRDLAALANQLPACQWPNNRSRASSSSFGKPVCEFFTHKIDFILFLRFGAQKAPKLAIQSGWPTYRQPVGGQCRGELRQTSAECREQRRPK